MEIDDDMVCRYCFEGKEEGALISPCNCSGGQKYVHLHCLRRWQRGILVSQPTHPAFYEDDFRHHKCNVCLADYTCPPPSRAELMASFTGPELTALLEIGCVIASHDEFSRHLKSQIESVPGFLVDRLAYEHWIDGAYLITKVEADDGIVRIPVTEDRLLDNIRRRLNEDLTISFRGKKLRVSAAGSLEGVGEENLQDALAALVAPALIVLEPLQPSSCADDHIAAVNLTRPVQVPPDPKLAEELIAEVRATHPGCVQVKVTHFLGGPCNHEEISCCIVLGGSGCGWTVVDSLGDAVRMAYSRAARRHEAQGDFGAGQPVRLCGLKSASHLNGELGLTLRFDSNSGRWMVRLQNGDGKSIKPSNLEPLSEEARHGRVMAFWGDAQWSRAQLLGEIARGSWGMCRASVAELIAEPRESRRGLDGRLAFAPISEMSDDYIRDAQQQMEALRATAQAAGVSSVRTTAPEDVEEGVADTAGSSGDTGLDNSAGRDEGEEAADETVNECAGGTGAQEVDQGIAEEPGAVYDDEGNRGTHGDGSVGMNLMVDVGEAVETKDSQQHASEAPTASAA